MNTNKLIIKDLKYQNVFNDFSISIENEDFIIISGPNNCGKTTLIRMINKEIPVDNSILLYGTKLEDIRITELSTFVKTIIPKEITFFQNNVEEELNYQLNTFLSKDNKQRIVKDILKDFKLTKISTKSVEKLSDEELIKLQIALALVNSPKMLVIDDLSPYFNKKDLIELVITLKEICKEENIALIMTTNNMDIALLSNYIYVISDSLVLLEGNPKDVLEKDNVLNKLGIDLPFMMDLSVKLRDYDLIKDIELDMDRMVETLWK